METALPRANNAPPYKRQLRNFLLMQNFQLKFTAYIVVISAVLSSGLGYFVYRRTNEAYEQSKGALVSAKAANEEARAASKMLALDNLADPTAAKDSVDKEDAKYAQAAADFEKN